MNRTIIITICLIITIALGIWVIWPQYQNLKSKQLEIKAKTIELQNETVSYEELVKTSEELKKYPEELAKIDSALPLEVSMPSMLDFLQKKASESGLNIKQFGQAPISSSKDNPKFKEYLLNLSLYGSYQNLKNFILTLEKSARVFEVESISFSFPGKKEYPFLFNLTIKFYSY